jgi:hypothetical protein
MMNLSYFLHYRSRAVFSPREHKLICTSLLLYKIRVSLDATLRVQDDMTSKVEFDGFWMIM